MALTLVAVLAMPLKADITAIHDHVSDAGYVGQLPGEEQHPLSAYLLRPPGRRPLRGGGRVGHRDRLADRQGRPPDRVLTTYNGRVFTSVAKLEHLIAEGKVRYAFLNTFCGHQLDIDRTPACSAPAKWVRAHGTDVSRQAGLPTAGSSTCCRERGHERVADAAALSGSRSSAQASGRLALDTEFMGEGRYRTLLCLIQLAIPEEPAGRARSRCVDPLAEDLDASPLADDARRPGRADRRARRAPGHRADARRLCTEITNVFDTQVAAGFAGLGAQASYDSLLGDVLGLRVAKTASFTRWDARPLSAEQLAYAREDVVHLLELATELQRRLPRARAPGVGAGGVRAARPASQRRARPADDLRAPARASNGLSAAARPIARELVEWREQHGRAPEPAGPERARRRRADRDRQAQAVLPRGARARSAASAPAPAGAAPRSCWTPIAAGRDREPEAADAVHAPAGAQARGRCRWWRSPRRCCARAPAKRASPTSCWPPAPTCRRSWPPPAAAARRPTSRPRGWRRELAGAELRGLLAARDRPRVSGSESCSELLDGPRSHCRSPALDGHPLRRSVETPQPAVRSWATRRGAAVAVCGSGQRDAQSGAR